MTGLLHDIRHAARGLSRAPAYSLVTIVTLALGLGLGTAAVSVIDGVLMRPLAYEAADRLVLVKATVPGESRLTPEITLPDARDLPSAGVFDATAAVLTYSGTTTLTDPPSRIEGFEVSPEFFQMLGVGTSIGRVFTPDDGLAAAPPVGIISHAFWERLWAPSDIVGRTLSINELPRTIVGVAPAGFRVELMAHPADVFVPLTAAHPLGEMRQLRAFRVIGRLRAETPIDQANAALATVGARLEQAYPDTNRGRTFSAHPLQDEIVGAVRGELWLVAGLAAIVLVVAAVNLAGLLLARTLGRRREIGVRLALGAGRWRLARESIAEGLIVSAAGAVVGVLFARGALDLLRTMRGPSLPRLAEVALDARALGALAIVAVGVAVAAGLVPLLLIRRIRATSSLRTGHETTSRPALRLRAALIVGQTSFAFVLLAAAVLLTVNLRAVLAKPLGFETNAVVTLRITVPDRRYPTRDDTVRFFTELVETLRQQGSVRSAGVASNLPLAGNTGSTLSIQGREDQPLALRPTVGWNWIGPGYFAAIGMPLVRGRDFQPEDVARTPHVTVINEALARLHFAGDDPIGKRVYFGGFGPGGPSEWHEVIGVVGDVRHRSLDAEPDARAYDLFGQHWGRTVSLVVRTTDSKMQTAATVRRLLAERDPRLAVFAVRSTADIVSEAVATRRLLLTLVAAFAGIGLAVALIGLYGTVSYMVAQRTRELGVRLALGATTGTIRRMVLARGVGMVACGVGLGLVATVALRSAVEAQLVDMTALHVPSLTFAALTLLVTAAGACLVPAARAVKISPVEALRNE